MYGQILDLYWRVLRHGKRLTELTATDVRAINRIEKAAHMPVIPDARDYHAPNWLVRVKPEQLFPSIRLLRQEGILRHEAIAREREQRREAI
jgi:hypothetical protein